MTSNGSTSRKPRIPGHTGLASCPSGRGWMEKCGANLLSRSSWDVDAGIAIEQPALIAWRGRRHSNVTLYTSHYSPVQNKSRQYVLSTFATSEYMLESMIIPSRIHRKTYLHCILGECMALWGEREQVSAMKCRTSICMHAQSVEF